MYICAPLIIPAFEFSIISRRGGGEGGREVKYTQKFTHFSSFVRNLHKCVVFIFMFLLEQKEKRKTKQSELIAA